MQREEEFSQTIAEVREQLKLTREAADKEGAGSHICVCVRIYVFIYAHSYIQFYIPTKANEYMCIRKRSTYHHTRSTHSLSHKHPTHKHTHLHPYIYIYIYLYHAH